MFIQREGRREGGEDRTSELQTPQLEGDQPIADLDEVDQGVEVVRSQNETVSGAVVAPSAQHEVATKRILQRAGQVLIKDGVQVAVITSCGRRTARGTDRQTDGWMDGCQERTK